MLPKERIRYLLDAYTSKKATVLEEQELMEWVQDAQEDSELKTYVQEVWNQHNHGTEFSYVNWDRMFEQVIGRDKIPIVPMYKRRGPWIKWVAAAVILFVVCGLWFIVSRKSQVAGGKEQVAKANDVAAPKDNRAVITLADGSKVFLDSVESGTIAQQSNVNVLRTEDGRIIYNREDAKTQGTLVYNTLTNPRGSKVIDMQLSDGSHVWLNAGSSVTYPVAFVGNERKVEITGEAYFEVAHMSTPALKGTPASGGQRMPFIVKHGDVSVTVLGTHFNVNAYDDEDALKVTLLEGSVRVGIGNSELGIGKKKEVVIKPGEQAVVGIGNLELGIRKDVDVDEVMAWKNGMFKFKDATIESLMRQIARWYDIDVSYEGKVTNHFIATIPRNVSAANAFKILEQTGGVNFKIEGRKVIVMQ
jgi:ferric-dicitrate binding protein FerR (iron transport regulator)